MTQSSQTSSVSPYLTVTDVDKAADFYQKSFQFTLSEIKPGEDGKGIHAEMAYKGQLLMFGKEGAYGSPLKSPHTSGVESPITLCLYCDNVDEFYKAAMAHGAKSVGEPEDMFWGYRMCRLQDLDHYTWCFLTPVS